MTGWVTKSPLRQRILDDNQVWWGRRMLRITCICGQVYSYMSSGNISRETGCMIHNSEYTCGMKTDLRNISIMVVSEVMGMETTFLRYFINGKEKRLKKMTWETATLKMYIEKECIQKGTKKHSENEKSNQKRVWGNSGVKVISIIL